MEYHNDIFCLLVSGYSYVMAGGMHSPGTIRMKTEPDPILDVGGSPASSDTASPYTFGNYDGLHNGGGASMVTPPMITDSPGMFGIIHVST